MFYSIVFYSPSVSLSLFYLSLSHSLSLSPISYKLSLSIAMIVGVCIASLLSLLTLAPSSSLYHSLPSYSVIVYLSHSHPSFFYYVLTYRGPRITRLIGLTQFISYNSVILFRIVIHICHIHHIFQGQSDHGIS